MTTGTPLNALKPAIYMRAADIAALHLSDYPEPSFFIDENGNSYLLVNGKLITGTKSSHGSALVSIIPGGILHTRKAIALGGTAVTFDFSATPITAAEIRVYADAAGTAQLAGSVVYCIDPPTSAVRDAWLTDGNYLAADSNQFALGVNQVAELVFTTPVSLIGMKLDDGTETYRVSVVGVEA